MENNNPWAHMGDRNKASAVYHPRVVHYDDEDEELQKALALSMQTTAAAPPAAAAAVMSNNNGISSSSSSQFDIAMEDRPSIMMHSSSPAAKQELSTTMTSVEKTDNYNCAMFHKLMWDDNITTTNDKERWIYECITTSSTDANNSDVNDGDVTMKSEENNSISDNNTNMLDAFTSQQHWGLTQRHGGPCGILAAIQAEMIRVLLWGRRNQDGLSKNTGRTFDYPFSPENIDAQVNPKPTTASEVDEAMAMAIAMILARASIIPSASSEKRSESCTVRLVFPNSTDASNTQSIPATAVAATAVEEDSKIQQSPWIEEMLSSSSSLSPSSNTSGLSVYSITTTSSSEPNNDDDCDTLPESKRPRKKEVVFADGYLARKSARLTPEQIKVTNLANAVSDYLLGFDEQSKGVNSSPSSHKPLDLFRCPGGVMFFVMSLAESRGISRIKSDMDDPNNTITSQFGHSSQELMNLLLTGQAVSNVFDNSMTLSEELTCRGIQYRPAIGYLSQLESLRYCEVGSYYKSPIFPIWIVASTNHFSVVFGDSKCLQESKSDLLLERCRRAFKKVEDGESGFIMKDSLGKVLEELDLVTVLGGDNGVQTLAAYVEVPGGGGIILWDDFWKSCSRLMTGSSLQAIMSSNEDDEVKIIGTINRQATPPPSTMSSDEELARKLAAEWGSMPGDDDSLPGLEPPPLISSPATTVISGAIKVKPLPKCPAGIDPDVFNSLPLEMQQEIVLEQEMNKNAARATDTQLATAEDAGSLNVPVGPAEKPSSDKSAIDRTLTKSYLANDATKEGTDTILADGTKPAAKEPLLLKDSSAQTPTPQPDFEKHGDTFPLYHYNGRK